MSTSLAAQLAARSTLDSSRLTSSASLKHPPSFIYTPRHAASISTSDLALTASNAWDQLASLDPFFERYQSRILGEEARVTDRATLTKEENDKLGKVLDKVLRQLGRHALVKPAGVVLEWLVRRFRVNDLNVPALVGLFLPYHTTPHWPSMLALIPDHVLATSPFASLALSKKSLAPIALPDLISLLPPFSARTEARPLLDSILRLPLDYLRNEETPHRALVGFWLQVLALYLDRAGAKLPAGERTAVLSTLLEVVQLSRAQPDLLIAAYILLARFALHNPFEGETLRVVMKTVVSSRASRDTADKETDAALVTTLVVVSQLGEGGIEVPAGKKFLGGSGWKTLLKIDTLGRTLVGLCNTYDAKRFMAPFLSTLALDALANETSAGILAELLVPGPADEGLPQILPEGIVALLASATLSALLSAEEGAEGRDALLAVLNQVYQRFPSVWKAEIALRAADNQSEKALAAIINSVLGGGSASLATGGSFLASSSTDVSVRVRALEEMLVSTELQSANPDFVRETLRARLAEEEVKVQQVLLSAKGLVVLHALLEGEHILDILKKVAAKSRDVKLLQVILPYLASALPRAFPDTQLALVQEVFWPRLLALKDSAPERQAGWDALTGSQLAAHAWLAGVPELFEAEGSEAQNERVVERLAVNFAQLIAEEIVVAKAFLVAQVASNAQSHSALLATLVSAKLCSKLDPAARVAFTSSLLLALGEKLSLNELAGAQPEAEGTATLAENVLKAPLALKTLRRARAALLLAAAGAVQPPKGAAFSWLAPTPSEQVRAYQSLTEGLYKLAHTASTPGASELSAALLGKVFGALVGEDALVFLAAVWTSAQAPASLKVVALRDAAVLVRVQALPELRKSTDFQTVLPSALLALQSSAKPVRSAALALLEAIVKSAPLGPAHIYARESFYGPSSSKLKFLEVADVAKYVEKLVSARTELVMDGAYLAQLHETGLGAEEESKKKKSLRFKISTFLLSHVAAWEDVSARTNLLRSLVGVKDSAKNGQVVALLGEIVSLSTPARVALSEGVEPELVAEYGRLLVQPYVGTTRKFLDSADYPVWETLLASLALTDSAGLGAVLRRETLELVRAHVFALVRGDSRAELFKRLVALATTSDALTLPEVLTALRAVKVDGETLASFLAEMRTALGSPVAKGAKRGRTSIGGAVDRTERLPELVVVLESVEFKQVPASHGVLLSLFDLLSTLIELSSTAQPPSDIQYPGQLLLAALSNLVGNITPASGITSDSIRMGPVLDLMRASANPATAQQALLLLAKLGPVVPEQLVHHVMPIFTFMGANVLQRDDSYSLRVVDQTLETIVPALVKATRSRAVGLNRHKLVGELKDLLSVFTDAATHVPRHRRSKLFGKFVQTLGAKEFLAPVQALLVSQRQGKKAGDAMELPLAVAEGFSVEVQLAAVAQSIEEAARLLGGETEGPESPFLDVPEAGALSQVVQLLELVRAELASKALGGKIDAARANGTTDVDRTLSELVRALLALENSSDALGAKEQIALSSAVAEGVQSAVKRMSIEAFSEALLWFLELADPKMHIAALALLRQRLPLVKSARRAELTPAVVASVAKAQEMLGGEEVALALATLDVVVSSAHEKEEDAGLAKIVPQLMTLASSEEQSALIKVSALAVLTKLTNRLGPRLIPLVAKLVPFAIEILREQAQQAQADVEEVVGALVQGAFAVLEGLFVAVPTFIGSQLEKIFSAVLGEDILALTDAEPEAAKARAGLLTTAAKKLPAKTLYPAIIRLHATVASDKSGLLGLLDLLNRGLRAGKPVDVVDNFRSVFKLFLDIFDLRRSPPASFEHGEEDVEEVEEMALGAFTQFVLKLNEQTFRPMFLRTYDWAILDLEEGSNGSSPEGKTARQVVLYKVVERLLTQLKSIFVPYYSFMLDHTLELLTAFSTGQETSEPLWLGVMSTLTLALRHDEGGFWTALRLGKLVGPLANQLLSPTRFATEHDEVYLPLLAALTSELTEHEALLKKLNTAFCMLTREDDLLVKRSALSALEEMWDAVGDAMLGLVPETTPFLSEALEEREGGVERGARRLVARVEEHLGESLEAYLN